MSDVFKRVNRKASGSIKWDYQVQNEELPFTIADSDYASPKCVKEALLKRAGLNNYGYTKQGDDYYQAIKTWYKKSHNVEIDASWIVLTSGVLLGIKIVLDTIGQKGDKVVIMTPVYSNFYNLLEGTGREILYSELINEDEHYHMDYENLEEHFKNGAHILLLCSPHNPVGRVWSKDELDKLVKLCQKYAVTIISDEIHSDIIMPGNKFTSLLAYKEYHSHIFVVSAPTKTFNLAGLLTAYLIIPNDENKKKTQEYISNNFLPGVNIMSAIATKEVYTNPEGYEWMVNQNKHIQENYEMVKNALEPIGVKMPKIEGTYILWLNFEALGLSDEEVVRRFKESGVLVNKGSDYGKKYKSHVRMCVACSGAQLKEGIKRILKANLEI